MITKTVKEYGEQKRMRIDINKGDRFRAEQNVVILSEKEYENLKNKLIESKMEIEKQKSQLSVYKEILPLVKQCLEKC